MNNSQVANLDELFINHSRDLFINQNFTNYSQIANIDKFFINHTRDLFIEH